MVIYKQNSPCTHHHAGQVKYSINRTQIYKKPFKPKSIAGKYEFTGPWFGYHPGEMGRCG
jgi:hypothetical protein